MQVRSPFTKNIGIEKRRTLGHHMPRLQQSSASRIQVDPSVVHSYTGVMGSSDNVDC